VASSPQLRRTLRKSHTRTESSLHGWCRDAFVADKTNGVGVDNRLPTTAADDTRSSSTADTITALLVNMGGITLMPPSGVGVGMVGVRAGQGHRPVNRVHRLVCAGGRDLGQS
jgi:hypothetical protein